MRAAAAAAHARAAYDRAKAIEEGRVLAWALCAFDALLGTIALFAPRWYADIFHPHLADPQFDLIRRMGVIWLMFCAVAAITATRSTRDITRWFQVLAVLRLMEVPADLLYGTIAEGATWWSRALLYAAPPINLAAGLFLYRVATRKWTTLLADVVAAATSRAGEQPVEREDRSVGVARP